MSYTSRKGKAKAKVETGAKKVEHQMKIAADEVERAVEKGAHDLKRAGRKIERKV